MGKCNAGDENILAPYLYVNTQYRLEPIWKYISVSFSAKIWQNWYLASVLSTGDVE